MLFVMSSVMTVSPVMNSYADEEPQVKEQMTSASSEEGRQEDAAETDNTEKSEESAEAASEEKEEQKESGEQTEPEDQKESAEQAESEEQKESGEQAESEEQKESAEQAGSEVQSESEGQGKPEESDIEVESAEPGEPSNSEETAESAEPEPAATETAAPVRKMAKLSKAAPTSSTLTGSESGGSESGGGESGGSESGGSESGGSASVQIADTVNKKFSLGTTEYSGEEDVADSWDETTGTGWLYLAEDQSFLMSSFDGSGMELTFHNAKNILTAGVNQLGSLVSSAAVRLIGTGILQLDKLRLAEESDLEIAVDHSVNRDGGVALFVKDAAGENPAYVMRNGGVTGIIDEVCQIPVGADYVVPDGETLRIEASVALADRETGEVTYYTGTAPIPGNADFIDEYGSAGKLTVPEGSSLTIADRGQLQMQDTWSEQLRITYVPELEAAGKLAVNGKVKGKGNITLRNSGRITGTGTAEVHQLNVASPESLTGDILWTTNYIGGGNGGIQLNGTGTVNKLNLAGAQVVVGGTGIRLSQINVQDDSNIIFGSCGVLGNIAVAVGKKLNLYSRKDYGISDMTASVTGTISGGGQVAPISGFYMLEQGAQVPAGSLDLSRYVYVYNESGTLTVQETIPFVQSSSQALTLRGDRSSSTSFRIPVRTAAIDVVTTTAELNGIAMQIKDRGSLEGLQIDWDEDRCEYLSGGDSLSSKICTMAKEEFEDYSDVMPYYVELISVNDSGEITVAYYKNGEHLESAKFQNVFLIRLCYVNHITNGEGGGVITGTVTAYTGSGRLGALAASSTALKEKDKNQDSAGTQNQNEAAATDDEKKTTDQGNKSESTENTKGNKSGSTENNQESSIKEAAVKENQNDREASGEIAAAWKISGMDSQAVRIVVSKVSAAGKKAAARFTLAFYNKGVTASIPDGALATVTMPFEVPEEWTRKWGGKWKNYPLFAVFRDRQGKLRAFRIIGGVQNGKVKFDTSLSGNFVIVCIPDTDIAAAPGTEAFNAALENLDAIKNGL